MSFIAPNRLLYIVPPQMRRDRLWPVSEARPEAGRLTASPPMLHPHRRGDAVRRPGLSSGTRLNGAPRQVVAMGAHGVALTALPRASCLAQPPSSRRWWRADHTTPRPRIAVRGRPGRCPSSSELDFGPFAAVTKAPYALESPLLIYPDVGLNPTSGLVCWSVGRAGVPPTSPAARRPTRRPGRGSRGRRPTPRGRRSAWDRG